MKQKKFSTLLLDLDGTVLDTAPELAHALNCLRSEYQLPALPFETIRPYASHGSPGLLRIGFNIDKTAAEYATLREKLLQLYQQNLATHTHLFPGMDNVLAYLSAKKIPWGIVTNKPHFLTQPLVEKMQLAYPPQCIVSGDTLKVSKPAPEPLWHACELLGCEVDKTIYVGDAERDIQAGKRAGMATLVALYGYLNDNDAPLSWNADGIINQPEEMIDWLVE